MRHTLTGFIFILAGGLLIILCLLMAYDVLGLQIEAERDKAAIQAVLQAQSDAWNRGDLDAFMKGYSRDNELTFFSGNSKHQGWEATAKRYRDRYTGAGNTMGNLRFEDVQIELTGPQSAFVRGRYHLVKATDQDEGLFTLLFRKTPAGWQIVHDHTSH
jgi:uncharacterized protein (TIGR02246 family)